MPSRFISPGKLGRSIQSGGLDKNPTEKMLKNRQQKLRDRMEWANACRFISAVDYANGKRFPKQA